MSANTQIEPSAPTSASPNKGRRRRRPSPSHGELLDRALDLFCENGFERTSIDVITATAGIAKRTVYMRYRDKKSLFKAALERAIDAWIVPEERLHEAETGDLEGTLVAIGQILVDNVLSPDGLRILRLTNAESVHMPEIGAYSVEHGTERTLAYLADLFRRRLRIDQDAFGVVEDAAETFLQLVVGGPADAAALGVTRDKEAIDRRIRFSVRLFLHGILRGDAMDLGSDVADAAADETRRLKRLLAETMIELDRTREQRGQGTIAGPSPGPPGVADR